MTEKKGKKQINESKTEKKKEIDVVAITKIAAIVALVGLLGMTPLGYISIGSLQVTTIHALVIIIAIVFGFKDGLVAGLTFGITSIITALTSGAGIFTPIFLNPLVSVVPRVLLPLVAYVLFRFFYRILSRRMNNRTALAVSSGIAAILSTVFHSTLVITLIWFFRWMSVGLTDQALLTIIIGLLTINIPLEVLFALIAVSVIVPILYPWFNREDYANHERQQATEKTETDDKDNTAEKRNDKK